MRDLTLAVSREHEVTLLMQNQERETTEETIDGARLIRSGTAFTALNQPVSPGMLFRIRAIDHDLIHLHVPNAWACLAVLLSGSRKPLIISHHADIVGREPVRSAVILMYRHLVRRARYLVVSQPNNFRCSADLKNVNVSPEIIPYCVKPSEYVGNARFVDEAKSRRSARFGDGPLAVFVGRLVPYKGVQYLIDALAMVPTLNLVVVGAGVLYKELSYQVAKLGLADRVMFTGAVDDHEKNLWLAAADFLVLPSVTIAEAFGVVQVEAMYWGKPVITTRLPSGVPEVGEDGATSIVVEPRDVKSLAGALSLLALDEDLRERLGNAGRARASALYSVERFNSMISELYRNALGEGASVAR